MSRRPELPEREGDEEQRKERSELNTDLRRVTRSVQIIGKGDPRQVASKTAGITGTWAKDLETGRNVVIVVRDGRLVVEEG